MKISAAVIALCVASANAFAPVAFHNNNNKQTATMLKAGNMDPVDLTMKGIDDNLGISDLLGQGYFMYLFR